MGIFRRAIIRLGEICALLLVICFTIGGAGLGYLVSASMRHATDYSIPDAIRHFDVGLWAGGVVGFLISILITATFFAMVEIARNTSERWFQ